MGRVEQGKTDMQKGRRKESNKQADRQAEWQTDKGKERLAVKQTYTQVNKIMNSYRQICKNLEG